MHGSAAQLFGGNFLPNGGLHQRGPGKKQSAAVGHQHVIAHHRQIAAAGNAHAHNRRNLCNAHCRHHSVVAEHAAEVVSVGEDVFLKRQEHAGRVDEINRRDTILNRDVLSSDNFLCSRGEESAGFYGGIIGDDHYQAGVNAREPGHHTRRGRTAPIFVHAEGGVDAEFEECARISQKINAFTRG